MACFNDCCNRSFHVSVFVVIITLFIIHYTITQFDFEYKALFVNLTLISSISITLVMLGIIFKTYVGARNTRISFLFLFVAYIAYLTGELVWFVYESIMGVYPYPSLADIGFFFYFVLSAVFLISIIRCYSNVTRYDVGTVSLVVSIIVSLYLVTSIEAETYDLLFGLPFVMGASTVFGFSAIALYKLRGSDLRVVYQIIFVSILLTTVADIWYYILENVGGYDYDHIVNTIWIISDAALVYALLLHKRII